LPGRSAATLRHGTLAARGACPAPCAPEYIDNYPAGGCDEIVNYPSRGLVEDQAQATATAAIGALSFRKRRGRVHHRRALWPVGATQQKPPPNTTYYFSDGGNFDNTGIPGIAGADRH
jgi:hypothetical protein